MMIFGMPGFSTAENLPIQVATEVPAIGHVLQRHCPCDCAWRSTESRSTHVLSDSLMFPIFGRVLATFVGWRNTLGLTDSSFRVSDAARCQHGGFQFL